MAGNELFIWLGAVWRGEAGYGAVRHGRAGLKLLYGEVGRGKVRLGEVRQGRVEIIYRALCARRRRLSGTRNMGW